MTAILALLLALTGPPRVERSAATAIPWDTAPGLHCVRVNPIGLSVDFYPSWSRPGEPDWENAGWYSGYTIPGVLPMIGMPPEVRYLEWPVGQDGLTAVWERVTTSNGYTGTRLQMIPTARSYCAWPDGRTVLPLVVR